MKTGGKKTLLTTLTKQGRLDMTMPRMMKDKSCSYGKKKMNMGGTVPTANTYSGKK
jgi:hypothetical protein